MNESAWMDCVLDFKSQELNAFAKWRGYSTKFCKWLWSQGLLGLVNDKIAFPIFDEKDKIVGYHVPSKNGDWSYYEGDVMRPFILGNLKAPIVWAFESPFDAFAVMDKFKWHKKTCDRQNNYTVVVTRNAFAAKEIKGLFERSSRTIYAFYRHNRDSDVLWLSNIMKHGGNPVGVVKYPKEFNGMNAWTLAGAELLDINVAINIAKIMPLELCENGVTSTAAESGRRNRLNSQGSK